MVVTINTVSESECHCKSSQLDSVGHRRRCPLDPGGHLFLDALVHAVVELLLADEDGERGEDAEEADGRFEGPEATLLHPRDHAAAVMMG